MYSKYCQSLVELQVVNIWEWHCSFT